MIRNKNTTRPSDFDLSALLLDSQLEEKERARVAANLIILCRLFGDWWNFTWKQYQENCDHDVEEAEKKILDNFAREGLLDCHKGVYSVQNAFIVKFGKFIRERIEERREEEDYLINIPDENSNE